jgi:hypothetical protein
MTKANFKFTGKRISIYGSVTLKNDGKVSISLIDAKYGTSFSERYQAKKLAQEIVDSNFIHNAILSIEKDDDNLIGILKLHTEDLKNDYIKKCEEYAIKEFKETEIFLSKIPTEQKEFLDKFGIKYEVKGILKYISILHTEGNADLYRKTKEKINKCKSFISLGLNKNISDAKKYANLHYENSISKLANRVESKKLNISKLEIIKSRIGLNLEMTLTDGLINVRAWTIVAEGEIQRPHYRYLVK